MLTMGKKLTKDVAIPEVFVQHFLSRYITLILDKKKIKNCF